MRVAAPRLASAMAVATSARIRPAPLRALSGRQTVRHGFGIAPAVSLRVARKACPVLNRSLLTTVASSTLSAPEPPVEKEVSTTVLLDVRNMKCAGCSSAVQRMLSAEPGVERAVVNLVTETAAVQYKVDAASAMELATAAAEKVSSKGFATRIRPAGRTAAAAAAEAAERREKELEESNGELAKAWALAGACVAVHIGHHLHHLGLHQYAHLPFITAIGHPAAGAAVAIAALAGPGRRVITEGATAFANGAPNMNSLVGSGLIAAFALGAFTAVYPDALGPNAGSLFEEPVLLLAFVMLGRALERRARARASSDLQALATLLPSRAQLVITAPPPRAAPPAAAAGAATAAPAKPAAPAEELISVERSSLLPGDVVRVLPGDRFPVDGIITAGSCAADEAALSGEPALVPKNEGSPVSAGSVCWEGSVTVRATAAGDASVVAGIAALVEAAQARAAPTQRLADEVAGKFAYGVMALAAGTFAFWSTAGAALWPEALEVAGVASPALLAARLATDVLVVACPCALGLATPTAVLVATSAGARRGLLLRGGDVLERLAEVDTVVFDKTGTLTVGAPTVAAIAAAPGWDEAEVLRLAAAAEATTRHPLAAAVAAEAAARGVSVPAAEGGKTVPGKGVSALVDGARVSVGGLSWASQEAGSSRDAADLLRAAASAAVPRDLAGKASFAAVAVEGRGLVGVIALTDAVRQDAAATVAAARDRGCEVYVMSGDAQEAAEAAADAVGIPRSRAFGGRLPADKAARVAALQAQGRRVAMVGDGVNDAPALAEAHVGVALSGGLDVAADAAGVVLLGDRLGQVGDAMELGRAAMGKIRQNLGWALAYNTVGLPLAAGALLPAYEVALNPSAAGLMMAFSSVAVVTNSLLLRARWSAPEGAGEQSRGGGAAAARVQRMGTAANGSSAGREAAAAAAVQQAAKGAAAAAPSSSAPTAAR